MKEILSGGAKADVQDAVNRAEIGGEIVLCREFDFGSETLQVTKRVTIRTFQPSDLKGDKMPTDDDGRPLYTPYAHIMGGGRVDSSVNPNQAYPVFEINASGVIIQNLVFFRPQAIAIRAANVNGLVIRACSIQQLQVPVGFSAGSAIIVGTMPPNARTVSGDIQIIGNEIDTVGGLTVGTVGILFNQAGVAPDQTAQILVEGNTVRNVTGFGIDFRELKGSAQVANNTIDMGTIGSQTVAFPSGIRGFASSKDCGGQFNFFRNTITSGIDRAAGIRLYSSSSFAPLKRATASENTITMSTPSGQINDRNAGIEVRGITVEADVSRNTIAGRARAALSVVEDSKDGGPVDTRLTENHHENFKALLKDITIGAGVSNTTIIATEGQRGTIQDLDQTEVVGDYQRG